MEFQLSCFKSWKMTLWKCCTQYASKFGKLSSGHRTGKVSFHSNLKERQCQRKLKLLHNCTHQMETHPSVLAWRIPGMGEPGGLPCLGSQRVGHDWSNLAAAAAKIHEMNTMQDHELNLTSRGKPILLKRASLDNWWNSNMDFIFFISWIWLDFCVM